MNSKNYFSKSIAAILSVATILTTVLPCTSAKNNLPDKKNTSNISTVKIVAIGAGATITLGLAAFIAYEHYKPVYVKDLRAEDQERWRTLSRTIHSNDLPRDNKAANIRTLFNNDSSYRNPKLLNAHFSPNGDGKTLLMYAARHGLADVCEILIKHGANVNIGWEYGTPLHEAALCHFFVTDLNGHFLYPNEKRISDDAYVATCKCLLRHGANVNAKDYFGETPLHYAGRGGSLEVINLLINNGADITAKDNLGRTPLRKCTVEDVRRALENQRAQNTANN